MTAIHLGTGPAAALAVPAADPPGLEAELAQNVPSQPLKLPPPPPQPSVHTVSKGENLSKIAKNYKVEWRRIWNKNAGLINPDKVRAGDQLVIPLNSEVLPDRPLPAPPAPAVRTAAVATVASSVSHRGVVPGNTYAPGNCTWYAKSRRMDLPNNLGNANTWFMRARTQGIPTGTTPQAGAIGEATTGYMHVVYVERVNGDGTILLSEMNYKGYGIVSQRVASAGAFRYIY